MAAILKTLRGEGLSVAQMTKLAGVSQPGTVYRWMGEGGVDAPQPNRVSIQNLAWAIEPRYPELARELVRASGHPWEELPGDAAPATAIDRAFGDRAGPFREAMGRVFGDDAPRKLMLVEEALSQLAEDDDAPREPGARPGPR